MSTPTPIVKKPSLRAVKIVGGVLVVAAALAGVGYAFGYETFGQWVQLAGTLVGALFTGS